MANPGWSRTESPFHAGELAIHERLGIKARMDRQGRHMIREYLTQQHQEFFAQLSYVIVGTADKSGDLWTSILTGKPGFMTASSDKLLQVTANPLHGDPLTENLVVNANIGLLGIELSDRRRNRLNGKVSAILPNGFEVAVWQSFGNCPQYIQARTFEYVNTPQSKSVREIEEIKLLGELERNLITSADTFFITTAYLDKSAGIAGGIDVSHRGGKPGFVRVDNGETLTIPDFTGNYCFNTIGNIELNPAAGLLFIDFGRGDILYLTGKAEIIWSGAEVNRYTGAERLIRFRLNRGYLAKASLNLNWSTPEFSPFLKRTGSW